MNGECESYLDALGAGEVVRGRVEAAIVLVEKLYGETVHDIFLSDYEYKAWKTGETIPLVQRHLFLFTSSAVVVAPEVFAGNELRWQHIRGDVSGCNIDGNSADIFQLLPDSQVGNECRLNIDLFSSSGSESLAGIGINCGHLKRIFHKYILGNLMGRDHSPGR